MEAVVPRGDVEAVARGRDAELVASRGYVKAAPLRGDEEVVAEDNFCILYRECQLDLNS